MGRARGQAHAVAAPSRGRGQWTEETVRAAVQPLIDEMGRWPGKKGFIDNGLNGAYVWMCSHGGSDHWKQRFGLENDPPRIGRPVEWPEERCRRVLTEFVSGRAPDDWPTWEELTREGLHDVAQRIQELYGGLREFAHELGFEYADEREDWDDARIERELRRAVGAGTRLPRRPEFERAGEGRLFQAMEKRGGPRVWAQRLGLSYEAPTHGVRGAAHGSAPEFADDAVTQFLADQEHMTSPVQDYYERTLHALFVNRSGEAPADLVSDDSIVDFFEAAAGNERFMFRRHWRRDSAMRIRHLADWLREHELVDDTAVQRAAAVAEAHV